MGLHLETERLIVREWRESDIGSYLTLSKDVGYNVFSTPGCYLVKDDFEALAKIRARIALFNTNGLGKFPVFLKTSGEFLGTAGFDPYTLDGSGEVELGYRLCLEHWGKGYATEAVRAMLQWAYGALDLNRVEAELDTRNAASARVLEKLGFEREGLRREDCVL